MSKASRRRQRPGNQPTTNRPTGSPLRRPGQPDRAGRRLDRAPAARPRPVPGLPPAPRPPALALPARPPPRHAPSDRHGRRDRARPQPGIGRRERQRTTYQPSFMERYRTAIVIVAALAGVALLSAFVFLQSSQPAYACSTIWTPDPTASPAPGATPEPRLRPARHGQQPRRARRQGHLHLLRPGVRVARQLAWGGRPDRRTRLRSHRQRRPDGLDP